MRDDQVPLLLEADTHAGDSGGDSDAGWPTADPAAPGRSFSLAVVQGHNTADDCWVVVHGNVYDVRHAQLP